MKNLLPFLMISLLSAGTAFATDYGDRNCAIYVASATNNLGIGYSHYTITLKVSKNLILKHFRSYELGLFSTNQAVRTTRPKMVDMSGDYLTYEMEMTPGALYRDDNVSFIGLISNGADTLYDNNFSGKMIELSEANNWSYQSQNCR